MATELEYGQLSNRVYKRTDANRTPVPQGWTEVKWLADAALSGFSAGVYKKGNEIVISLTGTNEAKAVDFLVANVPLGLGATSSQVIEAMTLYFQTKAQFPDATISFTGHSLGGGLASMMAVFFNKDATVFDPAPFELGARNLVSLLTYLGAMTSLGYSDPVFTAYATSIGIEDFAARETRVQAVSLESEILGMLRADWATIAGGSEKVVPVGPQTLLNATGAAYLAARTELHSMTLLTAILRSSAFAQAVQQSPHALALFFDSALYKRNPETSDEANFLDRLLVRDMGASTSGVGAQPVLNRFAADLQRLNTPYGMTGQPSVVKALTVAAMEYYYFNEAANTSALFLVNGNGVHLNFADFGVAQLGLKSPRLLAAAMQPFVSAEEWAVVGLKLETQDAWHVQSDTSAMNWTASAAAYDAAVGGAQADVLDGGAGDDILIGGAGQDSLSGGSHNDTLIGGVGADLLSGGDGNDRLMGGAEGDTLNGQGGNDVLDAGADNDTLNGGDGSDNLLGGGGDDTLDGGLGSDQLKGGEGTDTYNFTGTWGADTIEDAGGQGLITIETLGSLTPIASGATKVTADAWQSANRSVYFTQVATDATHNNLIVSFADRTDTITIRNWADGDLGISLPGVIAPPVTTATFEGDFDKQHSTTAYAVNLNGYVSAGPLPDAPDVILGLSADETLRGLGGNDGLAGNAGADLIEGGDGSDLLLGGTGADTINGGAGADYIYGSAVGSIDRPEGVDFTLPEVPAGEVELGRGFSWVAYRNPGQRVVGDAFTPFTVGVAGADLAVAYSDGLGGYLVESTGNIIDGGAGADYIAAGTGADIVLGGDDDDDIDGMDDGDVLFGGAGADIIYGDGTANPLNFNSPSYTPASEHGSDILSGGAGNDVLVGGGQGDQLYGGSEDDWLWGDGPNLTDTPAAVHGEDYLDGGAGADYLDGGGKDDQLHGGIGNDTLWGDGPAGVLPVAVHGSDYLDGGEDDDQLAGAGGADMLIGGAGNDVMWGDDIQSRLAVSAHGDDEMYGGDGNDNMVGGGKDDWLEGGAGADVMRGDDSAADLDIAAHGKDFLDGGAGNDTLIGGGGDDDLFGGADNDVVRGDDFEAEVPASAHGNDWVEGEAGDDALYGGGGNDTLIGGTGSDYLAGGAGDDSYRFGVGQSPTDALGAVETINDTEGRNRVVLDSVAASAVAVFAAQDGTLVLDYSASDRIGIVGGQGASVSSFEIGGTVLSYYQLVGQYSSTPMIGTDAFGLAHAAGGKNADTLITTTAFATLSGGRGIDTLSGSGGRNSYLYSLGDASDSIADFSAKTDAYGTAMPNRIVFGQGIAVGDIKLGRNGTELKLQVGADASDSITLTGFDAGNAAAPTPIDNFVFDDGSVLTYAQLIALGFDGTAGNDDMSGTALDDQLRGAAGNDTLRGLAGNDTLDGGAGNDSLIGGTGDDTYLWVPGGGLDVVADGDASVTAIDTLRIGGGVLPGSLTYLRNGNDLQVRSANALDQILVVGHFIGTGVERMVFDNGTVWTAADIAANLTNELSEGADVFTATAAADIIFARGGNDVVRSLGGSDFIDGGAGNDTLYGGDGNDSMTGGADPDVLFGDAGNDAIDGRGDGARDNMTGGLGSDVYLFGRGSGADYVYEFDGSDGLIDVLRVDAGVSPGDLKVTAYQLELTIAIIGTTDSITMTAPQYSGANKLDRIEFADGTVWNEAQWMQRFLADLATNGNDTISGFASDDTIIGLSGSDRLSGLAGNDSLNGGFGNDTLYGGDGNDSLDGGEPNYWSNFDYLYGEAGNDTLRDGQHSYGGTGSDTYTMSAWGVTERIFEVVDVGPSEMDALVLAPGIAPAAVRLGRGFNSTSQDYDDLQIQVPGVAGEIASLYLDRYFFSQDNSYKVEEIRFSDGTIWTPSDVLAIIAASQSTSGDDAALGYRWDDTLQGGLGNDRLDGFAGNDIIDGGGGRDLLRGGVGDDTFLFGLDSGYDRIDDSSGADRILLAPGIGSANVELYRIGNDLRLVLNQSATQLEVIGQFSTGTQAIERIEFADGTFWDSVAIQSRAVNVALSSSIAAPGFLHLNLQGIGGLQGNDGSNVFNGPELVWWVPQGRLAGQGDAWMTGGAGDDVYWVDSLTRLTFADDTVVEGAGAGTDTVMLVAYHYTLPANVENLVAASNENWWWIDGNNQEVQRQLIGNAANNVIDVRNWSASSLIDGGGGADTMYGHTGRSDTYVVDNIGDLVIEAGNPSLPSAVDTVRSSVDYQLPVNVEKLVLTGAGAINGFGNDFANELDGTLNPASNVLSGGWGNDTYRAGAGDVVAEAVNGGIDTVVLMGANSSYSLADFGNVENVSLDNAAFASSVLGDANANQITGNNYANLIQGGDGNDTLFDALSVSANDNDQLYGGAGDDILHTYSGADVLDGGAGNDVHNVNAGAAAVVQFGFGDGQDRLNSSSAATRIAFDAGVQPDQLMLSRSGADLIMTLGTGPDSITVSSFFIDATSAQPSGKLDRVVFADGKAITAPQLVLRLQSGNSNVGSAGADLLIGSAVADTLDGLGGADIVWGMVGSDGLSGGDGDDILDGGADDDTLFGGAGNDTIDGGAGADELSGGQGDDSLSGGEGSDIVRCNRGDGRDTVVDGQGDSVRFGPGIAPADVSYSRSANDLVISIVGTTDQITVQNFLLLQNQVDVRFIDGSVVAASTIYDAVNSISGTAGNDVLNGTAQNDRMFGLAGSDQLYGLAGADWLDGGAGADTMTGGAGDDTYVVDSATDSISESAGAGTDAVLSAITWTLGTNLETLTLTGSSPINGTGNTLANVITGNAGNNAINGGTGADTLIGGAGNDTYTVDNALDAITESANEGTDSVSSSVSYMLAVNVENLTLTGTGTFSATGNALDNVLTGNSANNTLTGGAGNDTLNGGTGNDTMVGGAGNDTYVVNVATDVVTELANEGIDTIQSGVTLTLGATSNVENLTLTGTGTFTATGNAFDNVLTGNSGNNTLAGNAGNDTLDGLAGTDTMRGGIGDDTYVVERTADVVTENLNEGNDTIRTSVTLATLAANVENLTLLGSGALNATGNALNNVLIGNAGINVLTGAAGNDTYDGAAGNDILTDTSTSSNETYRWGTGSGADALTDSGGALDHVDLFAGITASQLRFAHVGNNLELTIAGNALDKLTINNWYVSSANQIEEFRLSDGSTVLASQVDSLIGAMAVFTAGSSATTGPTMTIQPVRTGSELVNPAIA